MQYAILVYETAEDFSNLRQGSDAQEYWAAWTAYTKALEEAGIMRGGAGLEAPNTASTLRIRQDKRDIQDGPFADTKEQLGGFYLIEVENLDQAMEWASRSPSATTGSVEVRPLLSM